MKARYYTLLLLFSLINKVSVAQITGAITGFDEISVIGNIELFLEQSEGGEFEGSVENCSPSDLSWSVKKNRLELRLADNFSILKKGSAKPHAKVHLKYSSISAIDATNGALICNKDLLRGTILSINIGAQSTVVLNIEVADLTFTAANSTATLTGKTEFATIKASSGSSINCSNMTSEMVSVSSFTNSECYINVTRKLEAYVATAGKVFYKGNPYIFMPSKSTFGKIEQL